MSHNPPEFHRFPIGRSSEIVPTVLRLTFLTFFCKIRNKSAFRCIRAVIFLGVALVVPRPSCEPEGASSKDGLEKNV
jgi:hypothetical protein